MQVHWLTKQALLITQSTLHQILSATVIYFNNHGVWFDETLSKQGELSVEHWVARLFAKCAVGALNTVPLMAVSPRHLSDHPSGNRDQIVQARAW